MDSGGKLYLFFQNSGLSLATYGGSQVISCATEAGGEHYTRRAHTGTISVKPNAHWCQNEHHNRQRSSQIHCQHLSSYYLFWHLNRRVLDVSGNGSRVPCSTDDKHHDATWFNNGDYTKKDLASSIILAFKCTIPTFMWWDKNCHVIIVNKTDRSEFVVTIHSGSREPARTSNTSSYGLGTGTSCSNTPSCIGII